MGGSGSGSCLVSGFDVRHVEPSGCVTSELLFWFTDSHKCLTLL